MIDENQESLDAINDACGFDFRDEIKTLQELVDKAKPMKPIKTHSWCGQSITICPRCQKTINGGNYCQHCGQYLDWGDKQ